MIQTFESVYNFPNTVKYCLQVLVYERQLLKLFKRCNECGVSISSVDTSYRGAHVSVTWECIEGHTGRWESAPNIRGMSELNLTLAANTLFSGTTYATIERFSKLMDMKFLSKTTYSNLQNTYLLPVIDKEFCFKYSVLNIMPQT